NPPLQLELPGQEAANLDLSGRIGTAGSSPVMDLQGTFADFGLTLRSASDRVIHGTLRAADDTLTGRFDPASSEWSVSGDLPLEPVAPLLGLSASGRLSGTLQGTGSNVSG